jgi:hypothetical protein
LERLKIMTKHSYRPRPKSAMESRLRDSGR